MSQLWIQLAYGAVLIVSATIIQTVSIGMVMAMRAHLARKLGTAGIVRLSLLIGAVALWLMVGQMLGVWLWAWTLVWLGAFADLEPSLYFSLAAYTTLGFGDVLAPDEWRILGALTGANGMLGFGVGTAALVEFVRGLRSAWAN